MGKGERHSLWKGKPFPVERESLAGWKCWMMEREHSESPGKRRSVGEMDGRMDGGVVG